VRVVYSRDREVGGLVDGAVVFTDLVGSTALAFRVGPEAAERLRVEHFSLLCGVVGRSKGREIKNPGDGDWQYNLVTPSAWAGQCRVINVELNDRTSRLATISFR